ncbi:MAG: hypothetical protein E6H08_07680 [Bacteroidetes bacterium]|nr:MAG: hypothetical protein E6H08_07680 [Bacteroidota bacterium]
MGKILEGVLDWSEVWATLIPLIVYIWIKPKAIWTRPLLIYLLIALLLGVVVDITWKSKELGIKDWVERTLWWLYRGKILYTLIFYNINSFLRLLLLTWFFYKVNPLYKKTYLIITSLFLTGVIINFGFFENIVLSFSSRLFTIEAAIILFYCLLYYYTVNMNDEIKSPLALPPFWIVMGLTLYTSVNFLIFLFYNYLINAERTYAMSIWNVHNLIYIVLMIFIAIGFKKAK